MRRLTSIVTFSLMLLISAAHAQVDRDRNRDLDRNRGNPELVLLGERTVEFRTDHDVINIGQSEDWFRSRSFRALRFFAERNDVEMIRIRLVYINGYSEEVPVDKIIPRNGQLQVNLGGERSYIKQIEMVYRSRPDSRGQALVKVYGESTRVAGPVGPAGPPNRPGRDPDRPGRDTDQAGREEWVELGCQQVNVFGADRDSIRVGRREGRFKAIRLYVRGGDVEVLDLKVNYASGNSDDIEVRKFIRAGERSRSLDLKGRERAIDRVDMVYRSTVSPSDIVTGERVRRPTVCVEGLQEQRAPS